MDIPSQSVTAFLESLQDARRQLGGIWSKYVRRGTRPGAPVFHLHGSERRSQGGFSFALIVKGSDGRDYDLSVEVLWNPERWTIKTEARVDVERGQDVLRQLPDRTACDLSTCMEQIRAAVGDLASFEDLVPGRVRGHRDEPECRATPRARYARDRWPQRRAPGVAERARP